MKKNLKKLVSLVLVVVLAMAMAACGSSEVEKDANAGSADQLSTEQLFEKIKTTSTDVDGITMSGNVELAMKITVSSDGVDAKAEMGIDGTIEAKTSTEPKASYMKGEFNMDAMGQSQNMEFENYAVANGDSMDVYSKEDGEWNYEEDDISEYSGMLQGLQSSLKDVSFADIKEYCSDITSELKKGNYTIVAKMDSKKLLEMAEDAGADSSSLGVDLSAIADFMVIITVVVDAEKYLPQSMSVALDMDKFEMQGATYELKKCVIEFTVDSYDAVTITVPEEALAAKDE